MKSHTQQLTEITLQSVQEVTGITAAQMKAIGKGREQVDARHIAMSLLHRHSSLGLKEIAAVFNRDHSVVIHAKNKVEDMRDSDRRYQERYIIIEDLFLRRFAALNTLTWREIVQAKEVDALIAKLEAILQELKEKRS